MVRAIRFVPPLARNQQYHHPIPDPVTPAPSLSSFSKTMSEAALTEASTPTLNPSEHVAALVKAAVSKVSVIPVVYVIPENIGDRISRLAKPRAITPVINPPKIPQPGPNWKPTSTVVAEPVEPKQEEPLETTQIEHTPVLMDVATAPTPTEEVEPEPAALVTPPEQPKEALGEKLQPKAQAGEAATVESISTEEKETSQKEEVIQIQCPKCGSTGIRKNGHRKEKQQYLCKDCGRQFVEHDSSAQKQEKDLPVMTTEVNKPQPTAKAVDTRSTASEKRGKRQKKAQGFGTKKAKK